MEEIVEVRLYQWYVRKWDNAFFYCEKIEDKRLELCKYFYNTLEKDYYYLQSDECIKETIIANEYEFLKDGTKF